MPDNDLTGATAKTGASADHSKGTSSTGEMARYRKIRGGYRSMITNWASELTGFLESSIDVLQARYDYLETLRLKIDTLNAEILAELSDTGEI